MFYSYSEDIKALVNRIRIRSGTIGYTSGVFDLFHHGHLNYLTNCKSAVDMLIVGVDDDDLVKMNKGKRRPFEKSAKRLLNVQRTGLVDEVFIKSDSYKTLIPIIKPSKYFIPNNREISISRIQLLKKFSVELIVIPYTDGISTTLIARQNY